MKTCSPIKLVHTPNKKQSTYLIIQDFKDKILCISEQNLVQQEFQEI